MTKGPNRKKTFRKNKKQNKNKSKRRVTKRNTRKMRGGGGILIKTTGEGNTGDLIIPEPADTVQDNTSEPKNIQDGRVDVIETKIKKIIDAEAKLIGDNETAASELSNPSEIDEKIGTFTPFLISNANFTKYK